MIRDTGHAKGIVAGMELAAGGCMGNSVQAALPEEPAKMSEVQKQRLPAGIPGNMSTSPLTRADQFLGGKQVSCFAWCM